MIISFPRAVSLENHKKNKSSRMRAVRVEVIGPEKHKALLEMLSAPQNRCKLMT